MSANRNHMNTEKGTFFLSVYFLTRKVLVMGYYWDKVRVPSWSDRAQTFF